MSGLTLSVPAKGVLPPQSLRLGCQGSREIFKADTLIPGKEVDSYCRHPPQLITRLLEVRREKTGEIESELDLRRVSAGALRPFAHSRRRAGNQLGIGRQPHRRAVG